MSWVAVGIGVVGIGTSVAGGIMGQKGASKGAQAQGAWTNSALNSLNSAWGATDATTRPFSELGLASGRRLTNMPVRGTSTDGYTQTYADLGDSSARTLQSLLQGGDVGAALQNSPMFQWQQQQGTRDIDRSLAARGLYGSGAGLETLARFNAQLQAEEGERMFSRLFGATQLGANTAQFRAQTAANQEQAGMDRLLSLTGMGANMAGNQAQHYQNIALAQGNAKLGTATQMNQAVNNQYQSLAQMGQGIGGAVQGGIMQYGNYRMNQPLIESSINANNALAQRYGMTSSAAPDGGWL